jgi:hypothetical protein
MHYHYPQKKECIIIGASVLLDQVFVLCLLELAAWLDQVEGPCDQSTI